MPRGQKSFMDMVELVALKEITRGGVTIPVGGHFTVRRYETARLIKSKVACLPGNYKPPKNEKATPKANEKD